MTGTPQATSKPATPAEKLRFTAACLEDGGVPEVAARTLREIAAEVEEGASEARRDERERCAQLAERHNATWLDPCDAGDQQRSLHTHHRRKFADLLRKGPSDAA